MVRKVSIFFFIVFLFIQLDATGIWNFSKFGFRQIPSASRQVIKSKLLANATFQQKFLDDFSALGNDELLAMMELMAKDSGAAMDNWILMLQNSIDGERKLLAYLESSTLTNSLIRYYDEDSLEVILKSLEESKKQSFLKEFGNVNSDLFDKFLEKPQAIKRWSVAPAQTKLIAKNDPELWLYIVDDLPIGTNFSKVQGSSNWELVDFDGIVHLRAPLNGPPPPVNFQTYKKFKKLPFSEQNNQKILAQNEFRNNAPPNAYLTTVSFEGKLIPRSNNGVGISPDFKNLDMAFQPYPAINILGNGNDIIGLSEPLQNIIQKIKSYNGEVKVPISGARNLTHVDFSNAWLKMDIDPKDGKKILKELELTWHHVDDLDINMNSSLQLVRKQAHAPISHSGSVKQALVLFNRIYNL